jgi:hypothetical protein
MKSFQFIWISLICLVLIASCSSSKKVKQHSNHFKLGEVFILPYNLNSDKKGLIIISLEVKDNPKAVVLDSLYFRGKRVKLDEMNGSLYYGIFRDVPKFKEQFIMSSDPYAEYGNTLPIIPTDTTFDLKENECVLTYKLRNTTKYLKLTHIRNKKLDSLDIFR